MKLTSLNADLNKIPPNQPPVLEDTLHAMISLCLDIQAHCCQDIDEGIVKNHRELNNHLAALSGLLCEIYDANSAEIKKQTQDAFPEQLRTVRKETQEARQRLLSQDSQLEELARSKSELEKLHAQEMQNLADVQREEALIRRLRDTLEQTTAKIRSVDLPALEQENTKLEAENLRLEQQMTALRGRITQLTKLLEEARSSHNDSQSQCETLAAELEQCQGDFVRLEDRRRDLEQQLAGVRGQTAESEQLCRDLTQQIQAADAQLILLNHHITDARAGLARTEGEIARLKEIYDELLPRLNSSTETLRLLDAKIADTRRTIEQNDRAIAEGNAKLAAQEEQIRQQQQTLSQANQKLAAAEARSNEVRQQICATEAASFALEQESADLTARLEDAERIRLNKEAHRKGLLSDLTNSQNRSAELETEYGRLSAELENSNGDINRLSGDIIRLKDGIEHAKAEHNGLFDQVYALQQELNYQNSQIEDFRAGELKTAQDALDAAVKLMAELTAQREELCRTKAETLSNRSRIDGEIKRIRLELMQMESPLDKSTQERDSLQLEYSKKEAHLKELNLQIRMLSDKLDQIQREIDAAEDALRSKDNVALEEERSRTLAEMNEKLAELAKMKEQLPDLSRELDQVRLEYDRILAQQNYAESEYHRICQELSRLKSDEILKTVEQYRRNTERLAKIRSGLIAAAENLQLGTDAPIDTLVSWELTSVNATLEALRSNIQEYTTALSNAIE